MSEDASFLDGSSYGEKTSRKSHFVLIFFLLLFFVIIILVGLYFLGASKKGSFQPVKSVAPTATPAPVSPTATPTPEALQRDELTVSVLNGSGVAGAAKGISTTLTDLGYTVKAVGNAKKFDYVGVTILITDEKKAYLEQLKKDLADEADEIVTEIDNKLTVDAEVIVGK